MGGSIHVYFSLMSKFVQVEVSEQIISQLLSVAVFARTAEDLCRTHFQNLDDKRQRNGPHSVLSTRQCDDTGLNTATATDKGEATQHSLSITPTLYRQNRI